MRHFFLCALMGLVGVTASAQVTALGEDGTPLPPCGEDCYVFAYFVGDGADGLHLAASDDGLHWTPLMDGKPILVPEIGAAPVLRDPHLFRDAGGLYHLVWTMGTQGRSIGYAWSQDLLHWSRQRMLPVMLDEPKAHNSRGPEIVYDEDERRFLIFWATTVEGAFPETYYEPEPEHNHRIYYTSTADFQNFSPTRLFYEPGFNVVDASIAAVDGGYLLFFKDDTFDPPQHNVRLSRALKIGGPYGEASQPITGAYRAEGPSVLRIGGAWHVYFDRYEDGRYGLVTSADLETWEDRSDALHMPEGARHGTVLRVAPEVMAGLKAAR